MSLRSPLSRAVGLGTARSGSQLWWAERLSALALVPLSIWFVSALFTLESFEYERVRAFLAAPLPSFFAILFVAAVAYHSYLGVAVIVEDYVRSHARKLSTLIVMRCLHWLAGGAAIFSLLHLSFGRSPS